MKTYHVYDANLIRGRRAGDEESLFGMLLDPEIGEGVPIFLNPLARGPVSADVVAELLAFQPFVAVDFRQLTPNSFAEQLGRKSPGR